MEKYTNLVIIGSSHIAAESIKEVKKAVKEENPDIIALELDKKRYYALLSKKKSKFSFSDIRRVGLKGFIFAVIGAWAEKKLGEYVGISPGAEMITAIRLAKENKKQIAFIDQDIEITLRRFSDELTWKEKWSFVVDIIKAPFEKKKIRFDLRTVPSKKIIKELIEQVKHRYPNVYKVLIDERNKIMAANLSKLIASHPDKKIVAVVGAGHEEEIMGMVKQPKISYSYSYG